jgi:hypothetical protein
MAGQTGFNIEFGSQMGLFFSIAENSGIFNIESSTFGQIPDSSDRAPRIMQLGLRISF